MTQTIEILAKRAESFQVTGAEILRSGKVRFNEGHLPATYRTPKAVRAAIQARPSHGCRTVAGIEYQWGLDAAA